MSGHRSYIDKLHKGVEACKLQLQAVVSQVQSLLDMGQVVSAGPFLYAFIPEGTPETKYFAHPNCLSMLARFTLEAYVKMVSFACLALSFCHHEKYY